MAVHPRILAWRISWTEEPGAVRYPGSQSRPRLKRLSIHARTRHESEQTLGDGEGQGSLACRSPWSRRVRYDLATEQQQAPMISKYQSTAPSSLPSSRPSIPPQNCHASNCVYQKSHHCFIFPIFLDDIAIHLFSLS